MPAHLGIEPLAALDSCLQADESSEVVWQAAVGCFMHLTTFQGHFVASWVLHTPLNALAAILGACSLFGW